MAARSGKSGSGLGALVVEARLRWDEATQGLVMKGREQQRELQLWLLQLPRSNSRRLKAWKKRANQMIAEGRERLVEWSGVASQAQVKELSREMARLSKKIDNVAARKGAP